MSVVRGQARFEPGVTFDGMVQGVRLEVAEFAVAMEQKLRKKDEKTHWRERPIEALKRLMLLEVEEFKVAHEFFGPDEAMDELRDIANYAMILWDRIRVEKQENTKYTG
jgi:hypothetical protein